MRKRIAASLLGLGLCSIGGADSWIEKDHIQTWRFDNGSIRVDAITDARNKYEARRYVKITRGARVLAVINGAGFDTLVASPNEDLFVGLSNSGLDRTGVVAFDRAGEVWLQVVHGPARFDYCEESISLMRVWHDSAPEDIHFGDGGSLAGITIKDCRGDRVNLLQTVSEAYARALHEHRQRTDGAKAQDN